ncbi:MAG: amino acid adenylation domain-containing protein, partial [Acutalibacteraceae bacterium]|nr:amino acid adenylation domain-containing protein [Acutalibacteraceae bacterium]
MGINDNKFNLTIPQTNIVNVQQFYEDTGVSNLCGALFFDEKLDNAYLASILNRVVENNDALRIHIVNDDGANAQIFCDYEERVFETYEFDTYDDFVSFVKKETKKAVNIFDTDLFRFMLCTVEGKSAILGIISHVISDGWSFGLLISEILSYMKNETVQRFSYKEFIKYEAEYLESSGFKKDFEYWDQVFSDVPQRSYIKPEMNDAENIDTHELVKTIPADLVNKIQLFCKEKNVTESVFFQALMMLYLAKINPKNTEIIIGTPILNRNSKKQRSTAGMFVSTVPVKNEIVADETIIGFIKSLGIINYKNLQHRRYPFDLIIDDLHKKFDYDEMLFDVMVTFQDNRMVTDSYRSYAIPWSENPLFLNVEVRGSKEYTAQLIYQLEIMSDYEAEVLFDRLMHTASQIISDCDSKISELTVIPEYEKNRIFYEFNKKDGINDLSLTAVQLFEKQVENNPDNLAVSYKNENLTFSELNAKSNTLAHKLRELGVGPEDFVAIIADRSIEMLVGILGTLKSGGAYVPIDPTYPEDRIKYILDDCKPKVLITYLSESKLTINNDVVRLDLDRESSYSNNTTNPEILSKSDNLAYVIYTSGTTGNPKGVMIENKGLSGLIKSYEETFEITPADKMLQYASYCFDQSVGDIFGTLCNGGSLYIASTDMRYNISDLEVYMVENGITLTSLTPKVVRELSPEKLTTLRLIDSGGEAGELPTLTSWAKLGKKVINSYGPTEATVNTTYAIVSEDTEKLYIGKSTVHTNVYIMNGDQLCGIGIAGELCITGEGVARGYLNRPELTNEKFVDNPFGEGKLYHSGDLARWTENGDIEYLGRIDEQVKIRGFRIELGEIETRLREIENIKDCTVIARIDEGGDQALYAYFTSDIQIDIAEIRDELSISLPEYMIPSYMMQISEIAVTKNGKIDKKALPKITTKIKREYVAPKTETEIIVCDIFCEILGAEKVSVNDRFFEIGGHSLRATRLVNSIKSRLGVKIALKDVFTYSTPSQIAKMIDEKSGDKEYTPIPKAKEKEYYPMSSVQKRTYFIQQMEPEEITYNMSKCMKLVGKVDSEKLKNVLQELVDRHEILRTAFLNINGEFVQKILPSVEADYEYISESTKSDEEIYNEFVRPFDLSKAKNIRLRLVNRNDYSLLMVDMHHIVSDGMSEKTLTYELITLYNDGQLEPLTHQFKDYSEWMETRDLSSQREYWINEFSDDIPVLDMSYDYPRPQIQSNKGKTISYNLGKELYESVNMLVNKTGATAYMIFLSSLMIMLSKYSRQEDIVIGSPISGRTHADTEKMLGMFVNTLAMRGRPEGDKKYSDFLEEIKTSCLKAYENQEYPFEELVEAVNVKRDISRNPLFDVMLTMQNNEQEDIKLGGVKIEDAWIKETISKFDMSFDIEEHNDDFVIVLEYCTDLFKDETAERILAHFIVVISQLIENSEIKLNEIEIISETEREQVLKEFNCKTVEYSKEKTAIELFEEQVSNIPDNIALAFEDKSLTYAELNAKVNQLAYTLRDFGVKPDDFVAIISDRSLEMVIGILGVLKSGGAYVPIDPTYPEERIEYMLKDSKPKAILTYFSESKLELDTEIPIIDMSDSESYSSCSENPVKVSTYDNLAYCIYTSGTTGNPKGVMLQNDGLTGLIKSYEQTFEMTNKDKMLQYASYCFDQSVGDIFGTLCNGSALYVVSSDVRYNMSDLEKYIAENEITTASLTPKVVRELNPDNLPSLRLLDSGGEAGELSVLKKWAESGRKVINSYGPTEATVNTTYEIITANTEYLYIGKPTVHTNVYIMNNGTLCGIGVPGELCITGDGVAKGYLNQPEITAEKFVDNPFGEGKLYHSGDLAKWTNDGNIEYLGRIDEQVKIRGFRIELGEIESRIKEITEIKDSAVIARSDKGGDKAIYAYYTSDIEVSAVDIRKKLSETLPEYMIPSYMMQIEVIPITKNGKLDKRALPDIESKTTREY